ncbi:MAG: winged helix-turn-helix domain-containing protein [bacterium]
MMENNTNNVLSAFDMLLEEVETEIDLVNSFGARAFGTREYDKAKEALERTDTLTSFMNRVLSLRKEWEGIFAIAHAVKEREQETKKKQQKTGRLIRGARTPEESFFIPILQVLVEMGGSGKANDVIDGVGDKMKPILKEIDYGILPSDPDKPRWRNTTQWARNAMVKNGFLKHDSPWGIWEISDEGRTFLENHCYE